MSVLPLSSAIATTPPVSVRQSQSSSVTRVVKLGQPLPLEEHPFQVPARRTRVAPVPSLEGGVGLLGGGAAGAAGAATTYLTAPQTAIIQPNQILQIQLSEDWQ